MPTQIISTLRWTIPLCFGLGWATAHSAPNLTADLVINLDAKINTTDKPVSLFLRKGSYEIKPVAKAAGGSHEGWSVWAQTNCTQVRGCARTVPTRFTGMHNNYFVVSDQISQASVNGKVLPEVNEIPPHRDFSYFLKTLKVNGYEVTEKMVYPDEASALAAARASRFTLTADGHVAFALLDKSRTSDNRGGMTLQVHQLSN